MPKLGAATVKTQYVLIEIKPDSNITGNIL